MDNKETKTAEHLQQVKDKINDPQMKKDINKRIDQIKNSQTVNK